MNKNFLLHRKIIHNQEFKIKIFHISNNNNQMMIKVILFLNNSINPFQILKKK